MPIYDVRWSDGNIYSVEAPEGASEEQLIAVVRQHVGAGHPVAKESSGSSSVPVLSGTDLNSLAMESGFVMIWTTLLAFLIFRVTAYKYWKKIRVTPVDNGAWCGGIAAALAPFGVMNKIAQRVSINEYAISLIVVAMLYFAVAFVVGFVWRTLKAAPIDG